MKTKFILLFYLNLVCYSTKILASEIDEIQPLNGPTTISTESNENWDEMESCSTTDMIGARAGTSCRGNSGRIYTKTAHNNLRTSDGSEWISPIRGVCLKYDQAANYCENIGAKLPTVEDVNVLKSDFVDTHSKMKVMFDVEKSCCKLDMWVWVQSSSGSNDLKTIWDLRDAHLGSYWGYYKHSVVCKK